MTGGGRCDGFASPGFPSRFVPHRPVPTAPTAWPGPQGMTTDHVIARGPAPASEATGGPAGSLAWVGTARGAGSSVLSGDGDIVGAWW